MNSPITVSATGRRVKVEVKDAHWVMVAVDVYVACGYRMLSGERRCDPDKTNAT